MSTNALSFLVEPLNPPERIVRSAVPIIDGRRLTDIIEDYENGRGFDPAGGYGGLVPEFFDFGPLDKYFLEGDERYVLGCDCGEVGCWPLKCRIRAEGGRVIWDNFAQPHRPDRDYSNFGPFVFEVAQYAQAISSLQTKISEAH